MVSQGHEPMTGVRRGPKTSQLLDRLILSI